MSKYETVPPSTLGGALYQEQTNIRYDSEEKQKLAYDTQLCRETSQSTLRSRAKYLHEQANKLENLAKLIDFMPKELEAAFHPLIEAYIYNNRNL